ncbi:uncharacterized protein LOC144860252 [Branchiostoma floridae x Branchiostoma japonicum]
MRAVMALWMVLLLWGVSTGNATQYKGFDYWFNGLTVLTYRAASEQCDRSGAHLADLTSYDIYTFLKNNVVNYHTHFWTGLTRNGNSETEWQWSNGSVAYPVWHRGEPNNLHGNQNCGLFKKLLGSWAMDDEACYLAHSSICQKDIDECEDNSGQGPCDPRLLPGSEDARIGICQDTYGSYNCKCNIGYKLKDDQHNCEDIDECLDHNGQGPCDPEYGVCRNTPGSYRCFCTRGYELRSDMHTCKDIDECLDNEGRGPCHQECADQEGSYTCYCREGYEMSANGFLCVDADDCRSNPCENGATCHDGNRTYACECPSGFKGDNCEFAPCSEDFSPPLHGAATCADVSNGGRFCTVACHPQHDFACKPADGYKCDAEGQWHPLGDPHCDAEDLPEDAPWPDCSRRRLIMGNQMQSEIGFHYNGHCQSNVDVIQQHFLDVVNSYINVTCSGDGACSVKNISVTCGAGNSRSSANTDTRSGPGFVIQFDIVASSNVPPDQITAGDQIDLIYLLSDISYLIEDKIFSQELSMTIDGSVAEGTSYTIIVPPTFKSDCEDGQVAVIETFSAYCLDCPRGTHKPAGSTSCVKCDYQEYQDEEGQSSCKSCPAGTNAVFRGAKNITDCNARCVGDEAPCTKCELGRGSFHCKCDKDNGWSGSSDGLVCGRDDDMDGFSDVPISCGNETCIVDNCPGISNEGQLDSDGNGVGDDCEDDKDNDGVPNDQDNCPLVPNPDQTDSDGDGVGSMCDNCVSTPNPDQANSDDTVAGDVCEAILEEEIAKLCETKPDGTYLPHPRDCSKYVECHQGGHDAVFNCPPGTRWSHELQTCAHWNLVDDCD